LRSFFRSVVRSFIFPCLPPSFPPPFHLSILPSPKVTLLSRTWCRVDARTVLYLELRVSRPSPLPSLLSFCLPLSNFVYTVAPNEGCAATVCIASLPSHNIPVPSNPFSLPPVCMVIAPC
jgi:hypothetical protein